MNKGFVVYPSKLKGNAEELSVVCQKIEKENETLQRIQNNLRNDSVYQCVAEVIAEIITENKNTVEAVKQMKQVLLDSVKEYEAAEQAIIGKEPEKYKGTEDYREHGGGGRRFDEEDGFGDYIKTAFWQAFAGDFTDESNGLGIVLSVVVGFIPYVGQAADLRDLVADVYNLIDDGPATEEWVALGFTVVGLIPGVGDFIKQADNLGPVLKHLDDIVDGLGDSVKGVIKHADEVYTAVEDTVKYYKDMFDEKVVSGITDKVDDFLEQLPEAGKAIDKMQEYFSKEINSEHETVGDFLSDLAKEVSGIEDGVQEWISDTIDSIFGNDDVQDDIGEAKVVHTDFSCTAVA